MQRSGRRQRRKKGKGRRPREKAESMQHDLLYGATVLGVLRRRGVFSLNLSLSLLLLLYMNLEALKMLLNQKWHLIK